MPRQVTVRVWVIIAVAVVAVVVMSAASEVRYLRYMGSGRQARYAGGRAAGPLQVSGCFWSLCSLRMGERPRLPYCLAER
jgi:hypothetical protein